MSDMCDDNRFEIIEKAKKHILEATNIDTSPEEMKVLDNFLFRCWQMGWLDKYDSRNITGLEFRNELVRRLNENADRYVGGTCDGHYYPETELFEVDEVYEIIDRVLDGEPEDTWEV